MNRAIVYAGSNPKSQDQLRTNQFAMTALSLLAQDLLGQNTQVYGAPCGATGPASMSVLVGPGRIYQMAALEPTAYSSLPSDSTQILKQGVLIAPGTTLACPAPVTGGLSINYLVQGQFQENDLSAAALSYWNAANPQQPFSGAGNNGIAQPVIRAGQFIVQVKAGTAAATGSQTTPTADAGWVPMYAVTSTNGATTLTAGNIALAAAAPFAQPGQQSGQFTVTGVGFAAGATGTCLWRADGPQVTLTLPVMTGSSTSNSTSFSYTGLPAALQPNPLVFAAGSLLQTSPLAIAQDNSAFVSDAYALINTGNPGVIGFARGASGLTGWTAAGTKQANGTLVYLLY